MSRKRKRTWVETGVVVALAAILAVVLWPAGRHHAPPVKPVDGDRASNCWKQPDASGSRHCARAPAPRFGYTH